MAGEKKRSCSARFMNSGSSALLSPRFRMEGASSNKELFGLFGSGSDNDDATATAAVAAIAVTDATANGDANAAAGCGEQLWEPFTSRELDGGQGLRATAPIRAGAEIHREGAALRCPNATAAESYEDALRLHNACVLSRYGALPAGQQAALRRLYSWDKYSDTPTWCTCGGRTCSSWCSAPGATLRAEASSTPATRAPSRAARRASGASTCSASSAFAACASAACGATTTRRWWWTKFCMDGHGRR